MGFLGKIFGSDKAVDGIYQGLDKSFFTAEEKAEYFKDILKAYEPFRLIQRLLASAITGVYLSIWFICALIFVCSIFFDPCDNNLCKAVQMQDVARQLADWNNKMLGNEFLTINGLYFGGGIIEGTVRAIREKRNGPTGIS